MNRLIRAAAIPLLLAAALTACSKQVVPPTLKAQLGKNGMEELAEVYKYMAKENEPAPRALTDLDKYEPNLVTAYPKLQSGEYVMFWGTGYLPSSDAVLAYEKSAADSGGLVLLQNGTVKTVTAAEFKSLRKAGG